MKYLIAIFLFSSAFAAQASNFQHNEEAISEIFQTSKFYEFILDYEVPEYITSQEDELHGLLEAYKLTYINTEHEQKCEYIVYDDEIDYVDFTGVSCDQPVDYIWDEGLIEID